MAEQSERKSNLERDISELRGVGEARRAALNRMGITTVGELLRTYPRAYQNRGETRTLAEIRNLVKECAERADGGNEPYSAILTVSSEPTVYTIRRGMVLTKLRAFDDTGAAEVVYFNQSFRKNAMHTGDTFRFFGKFAAEGNRLLLNSPITEAVREDSPLPAIVPVYPLASGLTQRFMGTLVKEALRIAGAELTEYLPSAALAEYRMPTYSYAVTQIHEPQSVEALESAKRRLMFDELYLMFLGISLSGAKNRRRNSVFMGDTDLGEFLAALSFELTGAQKRSVDEILADLSGEYLMNRILTGDVGSGKTVVAQAAVYTAVKNGYRAAVMAPTEILAHQHYADFQALFGRLGMNVALLTGDTKKKERERILADLAGEPTIGGDIDIIVGTHALISEGVNIERLGLAVIDEQHRFGVMQRAALFGKADSLHCLVMSATPIPRTLTLAAYGSIDVSRIDELPKGRQKIDTFLVDERYRERLNGFIRKQAQEGRQTYVVCPAVEESEKEEPDDSEELANLPLIELAEDYSVPLKAAKVYAAALSEALPELRIGFVHGRLKSSEKDRVMTEFAEGRLDVLVSTTVIEVGVNVPNATLMIVENAERFGLAQLHQLRGRVGRGNAKSYFILVSDTKQPEALERLRAVKSTTDGFAIAEYDLEQRGPGDFFSESGMIRQSGQRDFRLAASCREPPLIEQAASCARQTLADDPELSRPVNRETAARLAQYGKRTEKIIN